MQDLVLCCCAWLVVPGREAMLVLLALSSIAFVFAQGRAWPLESVVCFACVEQHCLCGRTGSGLAVGVSCKALHCVEQYGLCVCVAQDGDVMPGCWRQLESFVCEAQHCLCVCTWRFVHQCPPVWTGLASLSCSHTKFSQVHS